MSIPPTSTVQNTGIRLRRATVCRWILNCLCRVWLAAGGYHTISVFQRFLVLEESLFDCDVDIGGGRCYGLSFATLVLRSMHLHYLVIRCIYRVS